MLLTSCIDKLAKLWDMRSMKLVKTYKTEIPGNAAALSPLLDLEVVRKHQLLRTILLLGSLRLLQFYDQVLEEEIGSVKEHFGPIYALAFNPDGKSSSSGGEDVYDDYITLIKTTSTLGFKSSHLVRFLSLFFFLFSCSSVILQLIC